MAVAAPATTLRASLAGPDFSFEISTNSTVVALATIAGVTVTEAANQGGQLLDYVFSFGGEAVRRVISGVFTSVFGAVNRVIQEMSGGSLLVKVDCYSAQNFLEFFEDYKSGKLKQRLEKELLDAGIQVKDFSLEIKNIKEAEEHKQELRSKMPSVYKDFICERLRDQSGQVKFEENILTFNDWDHAEKLYADWRKENKKPPKNDLNSEKDALEKALTCDEKAKLLRRSTTHDSNETRQREFIIEEGVIINLLKEVTRMKSCETPEDTEPPNIALEEFNPPTVAWSTIQKEIDVLVITVNDNEHKAATRMLSDAKLSHTGSRIGPFYCGDIGKNFVALVQSEQGAIGIAAMQATVQDAIDELNPKVIVLVGVCFGMNKAKQKLGDLVVSTRVAFYSIGRDNKDGSFISRGPVVDRDARIVRSFRRGKDRWIPPSYGKVDPQVSFGLVISGPKLIDNPERKQELLQSFPEALGGEMEAEGVYSSCSRKRIPWIVCKSICDWADGTKNEEWQPYAASVAASYAKCVMEMTYLPEMSEEEQPNGSAATSSFQECSSSKLIENEQPDGGFVTSNDKKNVSSELTGDEQPNECVDKFCGQKNESPRQSSITMVRQIPYLVRRKICGLLNGKRLLGNDFQTFAGHVDMKTEQVKLVGGRDNPADEVLTWWETKDSATIQRFREILKEMQREDVLEIVNKL